MKPEPLTRRNIVYRTKLAIRTAWSKWKYRKRAPVRWPWVTRKKYDAEIKRLNYQLAQNEAAWQRKADEVDKYVMDITHKYMSFRYSHTGRRYGIMVEFDSDIIRFVTPGDQDAVRYLARQMAHNLERELLTLNFIRVTEDAENTRPVLRPTFWNQP